MFHTDQKAFKRKTFSILFAGLITRFLLLIAVFTSKIEIPVQLAIVFGIYWIANIAHGMVHLVVATAESRQRDEWFSHLTLRMVIGRMRDGSTEPFDEIVEQATRDAAADIAKGRQEASAQAELEQIGPLLYWPAKLIWSVAAFLIEVSLAAIAGSILRTY